MFEFPLPSNLDGGRSEIGVRVHFGYIVGKKSEGGRGKGEGGKGAFWLYCWEEK